MIKQTILIFSIFVFHNIIGASELNTEHSAIYKHIIRIFNCSEYLIHPIPMENVLTTGHYFSVNNSQTTLGYLYVGRIYSCRSGGCSDTPQPNTDNNFEYFDYFSIYDTSGTILLVHVFNYRATYGQEICSKNWLKQFIGYQGKTELYVNENIDAISGATISVYSITRHIAVSTFNLRKYLTRILKPIQPSVTGN